MNLYLITRKFISLDWICTACLNLHTRYSSLTLLIVKNSHATHLNSKVIKYLRETDQELATLAKQRYGCFDVYGEDTHKYAFAAALGRKKSCQDQVTKMLVDMVKRYSGKLR